MSLIDDFVRMRRYRERASEFELLAENEPLSEVRFRYRIIARHYRELADRDERNDQAKMAECLEMLNVGKQQSRCPGAGFGNDSTHYPYPCRHLRDWAVTG